MAQPSCQMASTTFASHEAPPPSSTEIEFDLTALPRKVFHRRFRKTNLRRKRVELAFAVFEQFRLGTNKGEWAVCELRQALDTHPDAIRKEGAHVAADGQRFMPLAPTTKAHDAMAESGFAGADTVQRLLVSAPFNRYLGPPPLDCPLAPAFAPWRDIDAGRVRSRCSRRNLPGGNPNVRLKARLNAASDS